jgi:hypothetical protein
MTKSKKDTEECPICVDEFTPHLRKKIACPYCNYTACLRCCKTYLMSTVRDPHCMSKDCSVMWNIDFLHEKFYKTWYHTEYQQHRKDILFSREESRLQETMDSLQLIRDAVSIRNKEEQRLHNIIKETYKLRDELDKKLTRIHSKLSSLRKEKKKKTPEYVALQEEYQKENAALNNLYRVRNELYNEREDYQNLVQRAMYVVWGDSPDDVDDLRRTLYEGQQINNTGRIVKMEKKKFVMPCPCTDCKGFLSQRYKCGVCETWTCKDCHEIKKEENDATHVCDVNTVETVALLKRDSKPCPSCGTLIHRYEGCPQMWCTQCKVGFDWNSGRIDKGAIHNPHYFEWIRQRNGTEAAENAQVLRACAQQLDGHSFSMAMRAFICRNSPYMTLVESIAAIHHVQYFEVDRMQRFINRPPEVPHMGFDDDHRSLIPSWYNNRYFAAYDVRTNLPENDLTKRLRILYLLGYVDKEKFKSVLQTYEKRRVKTNGLLQVYRMYVDSSKDILIRLENDLATALIKRNAEPNNAHEINEKAVNCIVTTYNEMVSLCKYINYQVAMHAKYNSVTGYSIFLNDKFQVKRLKRNQFSPISPDADLPVDETVTVT